MCVALDYMTRLVKWKGFFGGIAMKNRGIVPAIEPDPEWFEAEVDRSKSIEQLFAEAGLSTKAKDLEVLASFPICTDTVVRFCVRPLNERMEVKDLDARLQMIGGGQVCDIAAVATAVKKYPKLLGGRVIGLQWQDSLRNYCFCFALFGYSHGVPEVSAHRNDGFWDPDACFPVSR